MRSVNEIALTGVAAATTVNSGAIDGSFLLAGSAQAVVVGTATGVLKLQASNDRGSMQNGTVPTNWSDIPSATVSISAAGTYLIPKNDLCYQWVRVVYTGSAGTGTISANLKAIGF